MASGSSRRIERPIYRLCGIDPTREQRWTTYAQSLLAFSAVSVLVLYGLQRLQGSLPLNTTDVGAVPQALGWNTAVSFVTNTNWQNYAAENTMSYLTQMAGLTVQNFVSAAVGLAVAVALVRGSARRRSATIGSFWVDLVRGTVRVLLPLALVFTVVIVSQGRDPDAPRARDRHDARGRDPGDPRRAVRQPGGDQGARHERRGSAQRQLRAPAVEPERVHQPLPDRGAPRRPVRAHLRLRPHGQGPAAGLGGVRGDVRPLGRFRRGGVRLRDRWQPRRRPPRGRRHPGGRRRPGRRQHGGQGGPVRSGCVRPVRRIDHRHVHRRGHRRARQLHPARRGSPAGQHDAGRGEPGRRRAPGSTGCWSSRSSPCSSPG